MGQETINGNILIDVFMGKSENGEITPGSVWAEDLNYHRNWIKLMQVVDKIENTNVNIGEREAYEPSGTSIIISLLAQYKYEVEMWNETGYHYKKGGRTLIKTVWQAVVQFIQWYTHQPK